MTPELVDDASFRITDLIEGGASPQEAAAEARRIIAKWRGAGDPETFAMALSVFRSNMQGVADDLISGIDALERDGIALPIQVQNLEPVEIPLSAGGSLARLRALRAAFLAVAQEATPA